MAIDVDPDELFVALEHEALHLTVENCGLDPRECERLEDLLDHACLTVGSAYEPLSEAWVDEVMAMIDAAEARRQRAAPASVRVQRLPNPTTPANDGAPPDEPA